MAYAELCLSQRKTQNSPSLTGPVRELLRCWLRHSALEANAKLDKAALPWEENPALALLPVWYRLYLLVQDDQKESQG